MITGDYYQSFMYNQTNKYRMCAHNAAKGKCFRSSSAKMDSPPPSCGEQIGFAVEVTLAGDVSDFDAAKQGAFIAAVVAALPGNASDYVVELAIEPASVKVTTPCSYQAPHGRPRARAAWRADGPKPAEARGRSQRLLLPSAATGKGWPRLMSESACYEHR